MFVCVWRFCRQKEKKEDRNKSPNNNRIPTVLKQTVLRVISVVLAIKYLYLLEAMCLSQGNIWSHSNQQIKHAFFKNFSTYFYCEYFCSSWFHTRILRVSFSFKEKKEISKCFSSWGLPISELGDSCCTSCLWSQAHMAHIQKRIFTSIGCLPTKQVIQWQWNILINISKEIY